MVDPPDQDQDLVHKPFANVKRLPTLDLTKWPSQQRAVAPRADRDSRRFCLGWVLLGLAGGEFMCSSRWSPLPLWCL